MASVEAALNVAFDGGMSMGAEGVSKSTGGAFGCSEWEDFSAVGAKASERGASLWGEEAVETVGVAGVDLAR